MASHSKVPAPLALADSLESSLHFRLCRSIVPGILGFDMSLSQLLLYTVTHVVSHTLTFVDILTKGFFIFTVAGLTSLVDTSQRTYDLVVRVLHSSFAHIGHVAVSTGDTSLSVDTHTPELIVWVLGFEDGRTRELVGVVGVVHLIVVGLYIFDGEALIVWEGEVFAFTLEVILRMALRTNKLTHMLMRLLRYILSTA